MTIHHIVNDYNLAHGGAQRLVLDLHKGGLDAGLSSKLFGLSKDPDYSIMYRPEIWKTVFFAFFRDIFSRVKRIE